MSARSSGRNLLTYKDALKITKCPHGCENDGEDIYVLGCGIVHFDMSVDKDGNVFTEWQEDIDGRLCEDPHYDPNFDGSDLKEAKVWYPVCANCGKDLV